MKHNLLHCQLHATNSSSTRNLTIMSAGPPSKVAMPPPALPSYATAPTPSASGLVSTPAPFNHPTPSSSSANNVKQFNAASAKALVDGEGNILNGVEGAEGDVVETAEEVGKNEVVPSVPEITAVQGIVPTLQ